MTMYVRADEGDMSVVVNHDGTNITDVTTTNPGAPRWVQVCAWNLTGHVVFSRRYQVPTGTHVFAIAGLSKAALDNLSGSIETINGPIRAFNCEVREDYSMQDEVATGVKL